MATVVIDRNGVPVAATEIVLSPDGSKVAFVSARGDLVPGDTNGGADVFLQDLATGEITRASSDSAGDGANHASWAPALSPDGAKLAFISAASNLAPGDSGQTVDLFVKDLATGRVERIGTGLGTTPYRGTFSPDGAKLLFASSQDDLVPGDTNYKADVFLADLATGAITRISTGAVGEQANGTSLQGVWSPDGAKVAFVSQATNLVGGSWTWDVFLKDLATGEILDVTGNLDVDARIAPVFSPDGSHIVVATQQYLYLLDLATRARAELPLGPAEQQVAATYLAFFGRGADAAGLVFWVEEFHEAQATQAPATLLSNIASSFGISAEAAQQYAFLAHPFAASDTEIGAFLVSVYGNLFGRGVDAAGKAYWTDQIKHMLATGEFVGRVLVDIMSGAQNPAASGGPHDALSLMGRVAVSLAYVHAQQDSGTQWTAADNLGEARAILQGVSEIPGTVLTGIARAENVVFFDS